jgi:hypothetical protein
MMWADGKWTLIRHTELASIICNLLDFTLYVDNLANFYLLLTSASVPIAIFSASRFGSKEIRSMTVVLDPGSILKESSEGILEPILRSRVTTPAL